MFKNYKNKKGFTLLEMTVSLGIFTIIMFMATSAFLSIVRTDRKARTVRIAMDNLNIALEDMSRRIKTGGDYFCGAGGAALGATNDCDTSTTVNTFYFTDQNGSRVNYSLSGASILRDGVAITSPEIAITNLRFVVSGSAVGSPDNKQPKVVVLIVGSLGTGEVSSGFNIQTTITQRAYDN